MNGIEDNDGVCVKKTMHENVMNILKSFFELTEKEKIYFIRSITHIIKKLE